MGAQCWGYRVYHDFCSRGGLSPFGKTDKLKTKVTVYYKINDVMKVSAKQGGKTQEETLYGSQRRLPRQDT